MASLSDPVGPAVLGAEPDRDHHGGSTGLRVFWSRSAGHVDWYHVTLEDSVSGFTRSTRVVGTAAPQAGFGSLVPGTRYTLSVVASSGEKNSTSVRTSAATGERDTSVGVLDRRLSSNLVLSTIIPPSASTCSPPAGGVLVLGQPRGLLAGGSGQNRAGLDSAGGPGWCFAEEHLSPEHCYLCSTGPPAARHHVHHHRGNGGCGSAELRLHSGRHR